MRTLVERAEAFAEKAHQGQTRKYTGEPYIVHPRAVAELLTSVGHDDEVIAAGLLHDVVEDCDATVDDLRRLFGDRVARLVEEVTDVSRPEDGNRAVRKAMDRAHLARASADGQSVKLADLIDNTRSIVARDPAFAGVYLEEKRLLLPHLTRGHPALFAQARVTLRPPLRSDRR